MAAKTDKKQVEDGFLMVKLDPSLKKEFKVLCAEEGSDMSKATRDAITAWMDKIRRRQAKAASQNGHAE